MYGDVELQKEEYINHVSKRLGTAQRKVAASGKKAGVALRGRGFGKQKQTTIIQLKKYYGLVVHAHPNDVAGMKHAVLATFEHWASTDDMTAARWELTAGVFSRRRAPPARGRARTESTFTHLSLLTLQSM